MSIVAVVLLIIFLAFIVLLYLKRISALLALPIMALLFAMVANVPRDYILQEILENGSIRLAPAMMAVIFGGILALFIKNQGIAEILVRYTAELAGDRPLAVAVSLMIATAILFTSLWGLGAVIIVGTIILPIMLSLGIPPKTAAGVMLIGLSMGGTLNISNWQLYISVLGLSRVTIRNFALVLVVLHLIVGLIFCMWSLRRSQLRRLWSAPSERRRPPRRLSLLTPVVPLFAVLILDWPIVPAFIAGLIFALLAASAEGEIALFSLVILLVNVWLFSFFAPTTAKTHVVSETSVIDAIIGGTAAISIFVIWMIYAFIDAFRKHRPTRWKMALLSPIVTLLLLHLLDWPLLSGFFVGALLALVITIRREIVQTFAKSVLESFESVGPAVVLIIGIGMLLNSVIHENIESALQPFLQAISPRSGLLFVVIFTLLTPLALYRGPLNIWGMGSGFAAILLAAHVLKPEAIMAALLSLGAMQGICDPTNTHNVWIATHNKIDTVDILKHLGVYIWPMVVVALSFAAIMYF